MTQIVTVSKAAGRLEKGDIVVSGFGICEDVVVESVTFRRFPPYRQAVVLVSHLASMRMRTIAVADFTSVTVREYA